MKHSLRRGRARRLIAVAALAALTAGAVPGVAQAEEGVSSAYRHIFLKQGMTFDGQNWLVQLSGMDSAGSSSDSVSVSLSKTSKKKDSSGKLVYRVFESQSFYFGGLDESTVTVTDSLLGSIKLGNQLPDRFSANITLGKVDGEGIDKSCNGHIKRRVVKAASGSSMNLNTSNSVFGNVKKVPAKGVVTTSDGKCSTSTGGNPCPQEGKSVQGSGSIGSSFLYATGSAPATGSYGSVYSYVSRALTGGGSWSAYISGKVLKSRISIQNDLSEGSIDFSGLPRLSGNLNATAETPASTGSWQNCGKDKRYRSTSRSGTVAGSFAFQPTGESSYSLEEATSKNGFLTKTDVGNRP